MPTTNVEEVELPEGKNIDDVLPDDVKAGSAELIRRPDENGDEVTYVRYEKLRY